MFSISIDIYQKGYNPDTDETLFQEMLKFNFITQKWSKVFSSKTAKMPKETVSNALTLRDNCLVVSRVYIFFFLSQESQSSILEQMERKKKLNRIFNDNEQCIRKCQ